MENEDLKEELKILVRDEVESIEDAIEELGLSDFYERPDIRVDGEPVFRDTPDREGDEE